MQNFVTTLRLKAGLCSRYGVLLNALVCLLFICTPRALAQTVEPAPKQPDIRLVIDVSGSMKRNDPKDLRQPAVELLVRLMPEGGKAGVWTFGKYVNMLVPHQQVDSAWRELGRNKSAEINSVGLYTNIGGALEKAAYDVAAPPSEGYSTSVILLTDGMVDISKSPAENAKEWRRIVDQVLPSLKQAGYTIHTVALSDNADTALMEKLALATDGTAAVAHSAEDLMKIFLQAFEVAAPAQALPLQDNRFAVDSSIEEFTALIFRQNPQQQTQLVGPDQQIYTSDSVAEDVNWYRSDRYDLITVAQPLEGEWQVIADIDPASRITVVSDLALRVKQLPSNAFRGATETLTFLLQEEGETVTSADFLKLMDVQATLEFGASDADLQPIWQHKFNPEEPPANGIYAVILPRLTEMGQYQLNLVADGRTFAREFSHRISVREPFTVSVEDNLDSSTGAQYVLTVRSHSELIDPSTTQIAATITKPDNRTLVKPLGITERDQWQTLLHADQLGQYRVVVQVTGKDSEQKPFEHTLEPMLVNHDPDAAFAEPVSDPEPAPTPAAEPSPDAQAPPAPEPVADDTAEDGGLPGWLLYVLLGLGNVAVFGGGYWLYRKFSSGTEQTVAAAEVAVQGEDEEPFPDMHDEDDALLMMDDGGGAEEEPPMEDLETVEAEEPTEADGFEGFEDFDDLDEPDSTVDEQPEESIGEDAPTNETAGSEDDAAGEPDDLDERLLDQVVGDGSEEEKADFADEILKAQGLDLDEDELDDAISNLIDELDGSRSDDEAGDLDADEEDSKF